MIIYHTRLKIISSAPQTKPNKYDGEVLTVAAADPTRSQRENVFSELLRGRVDVLLLGFRSSVCVSASSDPHLVIFNQFCALSLDFHPQLVSTL